MQKKLNITNSVMKKIENNDIKLKSKWYFTFLSVILTLGTILTFISSVFLFSILNFLLKTHGPRYEYRLNLMLGSFPFYIPIFAVVFLVSGFYLLKKYEFSNKIDFKYILLIGLISIFLGGFVIDFFNLNNIGFRKERMFERKQDSKFFPKNNPNLHPKEGRFLP